MAYEDPKIDWVIGYTPSPPDMNRVEGNIKALAEENMTVSGDKTFTGDSTHSGDNTFSGENTLSGINTINAGGGIDRDNSGVFTKRTLFTGTFDGSGNVQFSSGISVSKFQSMAVMIYNSTNSAWLDVNTFGAFRAWVGSEPPTVYFYDTGDIRIYTNSSTYANKAYRVTVLYEA